MKKILLLILILRPLIDLPWNKHFLGINFAGYIGIALSFLVIGLLFTKNKELFYPKSFILFLPLIFISNVIFNKSLVAYALFFRILSATVYLFYFWKDETNLEKIELFMKWFIIVSLVPIAMSYCQYFGVIPYTYWDWLPGIGELGRASGGYMHPTSLNRILTFTILFSLYFIHSKKQFWPYILYILLASFSVLISHHRATYVIVPMIFLIWYADLFKKLRFAQKKFIFFIFLFIFSILLIAIIPLFHDKIVGMFDAHSISGFHGRGVKFQRIFLFIRQNTWLGKLLGNGSNFSFKGQTTFFIDNDFLSFLWRYGILGVFAWLLVVLDFFLSTFRLKQAIKLKDYLFNKLTRVVFVCYILFGLILEVTLLPNFMYIVYSAYVVNRRNIISNYKDTQLRRIDNNLVITLIMAIAVLCCIFTYWLHSI